MTEEYLMISVFSPVSAFWEWNDPRLMAPKTLSNTFSPDTGRFVMW